jgi:2-polyprenyl-3-methyl-5-hydroxy-6-metoxy-1,4-benzoquinol methylase
MRFIYKNTFISESKLQYNRIEAGAKILFDKISQLNIEDLPISDYNKRYFGNIKRELRSELQKYGYLLGLSTQNIENLNNAVFIDYGGGHGTFALLARAIGIGMVIHNDIYDVSCKDAEIIAKAIGLKADHYVPGNIDDLVDYLKQEKMNVDIISSYDVIEHIYDITDYISKLPAIPSRNLKFVFGSGANMYNPLLNYLLKKNHKIAEKQNRERVKGSKERDTYRSYIEVRKEIIKNNFIDISDDKLDYLSVATRGLIEEDIVKYVKQYMKSGVFEYKPDHPTNTCDPLTGNWLEHLMSKDFLIETFKKSNYKVKITSGFHKSYNNPIVRFIGGFINLFISATKQKNLLFSPYYIVSSESIVETKS